jgi:hypothetical protein
MTNEIDNLIELFLILYLVIKLLQALSYILICELKNYLKREYDRRIWSRLYK